MIRKKIAALVAALACLAGLQVVVPPAASADTSIRSCSNDARVCMTVYYHNYSGDFGFYIYSVKLWCDNGPDTPWQWDHPAVDGHYLRLYKNPYSTNQLVLSRSDADSNVDTNAPGQCVRTIPINTEWPNADSLEMDWSFTEQRDLKPDVSDYISIWIHDGQDV